LFSCALECTSFCPYAIHPKQSCMLTPHSVIQSVPNTFGVLIFGRLVTGLGFGCVYIATNLYVAECSPQLLRGSFVGTVSQFGYQLGTLIAFWAGYGMSFHKSPYNVAWRVSNLIQIPIGLLFVVISFWYPER
jgi:MFS family permease